MKNQNNAPQAPSSAYFCNVLAAARMYKLDGHWSGSAYQCHPCGVIRKGIIFCNEWNTNNYCYASVMSDPSEGLNSWCKNGRAMNGDPYPHPAKGSELKVYNTGSWRVDGEWQQVIVDTLEELENEVEEAKIAKEWDDKIESIERKRKRDSEIADFRQAFGKTIRGDLK